MLGYIVPLKAELKVREFEAYQAYYCGICMSIKARYGNCPRLTLSYDSAFLALMLGGGSIGTEVVKTKRCIANPFRKRNIVYGEKAIDYAADMMLLLAYYKFKDDLIDDRSAKAFSGTIMLKKSMKSLLQRWPNKCKVIKENIDALSEYEKVEEISIDPAAEPFAKLMEEIFDCSELSQNNRVIFRKFGYYLGKWIFLIDAYDDIEKDAEKKSYNPLILQHGFCKDKIETITQFKERIKDRTELNLHLYLGEMSKLYEEMNFLRNKGVVENILYFGLYRKTEEVLQEIAKEDIKKEKIEHAKSI